MWGLSASWKPSNHTLSCPAQIGVWRTRLVVPPSLSYGGWLLSKRGLLAFAKMLWCVLWPGSTICCVWGMKGLLLVLLKTGENRVWLYIRNRLSSRLCGGRRCRLPVQLGFAFCSGGSGQCSDHVPETWQPRTPLGGSGPSQLNFWPHCPKMSSLPSFSLYGGWPQYGVPAQETWLTGLLWSCCKQWSTGLQSGYPAWSFCNGVLQM